MAPDVDGWIAQAKKLQADIERSKATAREIVAQAQAGKKLQEEADDASSKTGLLEKEVAFSASLFETLERIKAACAILDLAQDAVVHGDIKTALARHKEVDRVIVDLAPMENTRAYSLLYARNRDLRAALVDNTTNYAKALIDISVSGRSVTVARESPGTSYLCVYICAALMTARCTHARYIHCCCDPHKLGSTRPVPETPKARA